MPVIYPNTSDMQTFTLLPVGQHPAEITAVEQAVGKEKGTPYLKVTVAVQHEGKSVRRYANVMTSGAASGQFDRLLRAAGLDDEAERVQSSGGQYPFDTDKLVGQRVGVVVKHVPSRKNPDEMFDDVDSFVKL